MDEQKPKPARKWRSFLLEFGTIVLGVSVALAAQQAADWWRWRGDVAQAREVIATEIASNLTGAILRVRTLECGEQRLNDLTKILDDAARSGNLPPVGYIRQAAKNLWRTSAWDSIVASEITTHFPRQELANLGALYKLVQRIDQHYVTEFTAWGDLYAMVGPGRRLDPALEAQLRIALVRARIHGRALTTLANSLITQSRAMHLPFTSAEREQLSRARTQALSQSGTDICEPIGSVPSNYSDAPYRDALGGVYAAAKSLPDFAEGARDE